MSDDVTIDRTPDGLRVAGTPEAFHDFADRARAAVDAIRELDAGPSAPPFDTTIGPDDPYPVPDDTTFGGHEYLAAPDLHELAQDLIGEHAALDAAGEWHIRYLWRRKGGSSRGKMTFGRCQKLSGLARHFAAADFVVYIAADHATAYEFTRRQLEALLFHELLHIDTEEDDHGTRKPVHRAHDAEVFRAELEVYGLWDEGLRETFGQLEFPGMDGAS